jgi:hypothetical protein
MSEEARIVWQAVLTLLVGLVGWIMKSAIEDIRRVEKQLSEHKTDVAKSYATKIDMLENTRQVMGRFDRLEEKIDRLVENSK